MHDFVFKEIINADFQTELKSIGFDGSYVHRAKSKFAYKNIKIFALSIPQANILKQTALSVGADCATHRETITGKVESSDCILGGSVSQLIKIADKLKLQPFGLKTLGEKLIEFVAIEEKASAKIVGILNLTEDSFSDGGKYSDLECAKKHLSEMIEDGADIIDIGAESTRPYSTSVAPEYQLEKLLPIMEFVRAKGGKGGKWGNLIISVDTRSAKVAEECIKAGAKIINDVSGLTYDEGMAETIAKYDVQVVIQHSIGTPETMQDNPTYENLMDEIFFELRRRIEFAISKGIKRENIIIDAGIGFGKTREQNFEILRRIGELKSLGCPIMLGVSRKSLLNMQNADNDYKDIFTVALNALALEHGVEYLRVHNVKLHRDLINMLNF